MRDHQALQGSVYHVIDPLAQNPAIAPSRETCRNWFVAATKPRDEALAEVQLKQQGFGTFLPRFRKIRRHARRMTEVLAPVFPGYCFVQADPQQYPWRSINATRGVRRLVGAMNGEPQAVPSSAMAAIFERCKGGLIQSLVPEFTPGMKVRLISTAFVDRIATVELLDDKGRVQVLLDLLGQSMPMRVSPDAIEPFAA